MDISVIVDWRSAWNMILNRLKFSIHTISSKKSKILSTYFIDTIPIKQVNFEKDLGVIVDEELSFTENMSHN